jgi:hypothetical protein
LLRPENEEQNFIGIYGAEIIVRSQEDYNLFTNSLHLKITSACKNIRCLFYSENRGSKYQQTSTRLHSVTFPEDTILQGHSHTNLIFHIT